MCTSSRVFVRIVLWNAYGEIQACLFQQLSRRGGYDASQCVESICTRKCTTNSSVRGHFFCSSYLLVVVVLLVLAVAAVVTMVVAAAAVGVVVTVVVVVPVLAVVVVVAAAVMVAVGHDGTKYGSTTLPMAKTVCCNLCPITWASEKGVSEVEIERDVDIAVSERSVIYLRMS